MNRFTLRAAIVLLTAASLILALSACAYQNPNNKPESSADTQPSASAAPVVAADSIFTVRYNSDYSFNPITCSDPNNLALVPLMYEGLFVVNPQGEAENVLCDNYVTADGITYTIKLKSGIAMSDGSTLTATDVAYSLRQAAQTGRFTGRLNTIADISVNDTTTLTITLSSANYKLPVLLDIPIIKYGSIGNNYPPGSGPYYYSGSEAPRLLSSAKYRDIDKLPVSEIYLKDCSEIQLSVSFSSQAIDLFWDDPYDASEVHILSDHETRFYETTILQFIGINAKTRILSNPQFRHALAMAIDRRSIVDDVYSTHAVAAPLVLSPEYKYYDSTWEDSSSDTLSEISTIFSDLNMEDSDSDGFLEYRDANGTPIPFSLTLIVNADNKYKVAAAEMITNSLKTIGINITLTKLSWTAYQEALTSGSFDLYYGDVNLPADYNLSALLSPDASIDFGHVGSAAYLDRINDFLGAANAEEEKDAAKQLCLYINQNAPIIPVLYRQYTVHTNRNTVTGLNPTQSNIFYGFTNWTIHLG